MTNPMVGNTERLTEAHRRLEELAAEALQPGFFGTIAVEITIRDGEAKFVRRITNATDQ